MKIIIVAQAHDKLSEFFIKQGSFDVTHSLEDLTSNLDTLRNNIIHVDKLILVDSDNNDFTSEIRSLLSLLDNPTGLLKINEIVFFYKNDINSAKTKELIHVVIDNIKVKEAENPRHKLPVIDYHELETLRFNDIYKELMGKSSSRNVEAQTKTKYRVERGDDSFKAFETSEESIIVAPYSTSNMENHNAMKSILQKTENPATFTDFYKAIPEYDKYKLDMYNDNGYGNTKWLLMCGDNMSGSTTHTTALAISASNTGKRVLIIDLSEHGGIKETLTVASVKYRVIQEIELLNNSVSLLEDKISVFEHSSKNIRYTLPPFMQARPNVFNHDLILISFSVNDLELILGSVNLSTCSLVYSTLLFPESVDRMLALDFKNINTLVWLNDHISSPLRKRKLTLDYIRKLALKQDKNYRFMESIFFDDFKIGGDFYESIEEVI